MKINHKEYSFEESLKFFDELTVLMKDRNDMFACDTMTKEDLYSKDVSLVNSTVLFIRVNNQRIKDVKLKEYVYQAAMTQMIKILQSAKSLRHLDVQADGGLMAMFDTPMKKEIEDVINLSAQVRSINDVVLKKFGLDLSNQTVTEGMDYGTISCYKDDEALEDVFFAGVGSATAKVLAEAREDCVNISQSIYINLTKDMQNKLFSKEDVYQDIKYHYAPLINIRMRRWVVEGN